MSPTILASATSDYKAHYICPTNLANVDYKQSKPPQGILRAP